METKANKLLQEILESVESIGIDNTTKILQNAKIQNIVIDDVNIESVLNIISIKCEVDVDRILNGKDKTDERKIATALCVYHFVENLHLSYADIKKVLNKDKAALSRLYSLVKGIDFKSPRGEFNKKIVSLVNEINLEILDKKIKTKNKAL